MSNKSDPRERRLKAIYDSLDSGNNKKAVQEADKVLRKDANALPAKALKALALYRAGRQDEAAAVMSEVEAMESCDESLLQTMTHYYKESHQLGGIVTAYERAAKQRPKSEELLVCLFMAYARSLEYKLQQITGTKLHKLAPGKPAYYQWTIVSILMQAKQSADKQLAERMLLPLAAKMCELQLEKMETEAEADLYLLVLEMQNRQADCLQQLEGRLGQLFSDSSTAWLRRKKRQYLLELGRGEELRDELGEAVRREPNDWRLWEMLIEQQVDIGQSCKSLLQLIDELAENNPRMAAPRLARLQLLRRLRRDGEPEFVDAVDLAVDFFADFAAKSTTAPELLTFAELFAGREGEIMARLAKHRPCLPGEGEAGEEGEKEDGEGQNGDADATAARRRLRHRITTVCNYEQMRRGLQQHKQLSQSARASLIKSLVGGYRSWFLNGVRQTELQPSDDLLLLAVSLLYDNWLTRAGDADDSHDGETDLYRALFLLDEALAASPSNHAVMLWMLRLFVCLGAWLPASSLFDRLDIKQMLLESMGYLLTRQVSRCGQLSQGISLLNGTIAFYKASARDVAEQMCAAYRVPNYRKISEMDTLHTRLHDSLEKAHSQVELRYLSVLLSGSRVVEAAYERGADPSAEVLDFERLVDAREFRVVRDSAWPIGDLNTSEELRWLRWRGLCLRCVTCFAKVATELAASESGQLKEAARNAANCQLMLQLLQQFEEEEEALTSTTTKTFSSEPHPCRPYPTNLSATLAKPFSCARLLAELLRFLVQSATMEQALPQEALGIIGEQLEAVSATSTKSSTPYAARLQQLCLLAESICLLTLTYELTLTALSSKLQAAKRLRRPAEEFCKTLRTAVVEKAEAAVRLLEAELERCKHTHEEEDGEGLFKAASVAKVTDHVMQSRCRSVHELMSLLQVKAELRLPAAARS